MISVSYLKNNYINVNVAHMHFLHPCFILAELGVLNYTSIVDLHGLSKVF